jgi:hypothetical protein
MNIYTLNVVDKTNLPLDFFKDRGCDQFLLDLYEGYIIQIFLRNHIPTLDCLQHPVHRRNICQSKHIIKS